MSLYQCYKYCEGSGFEYAMVHLDTCYCTWQEDWELEFDTAYDDEEYEVWYSWGEKCETKCSGYQGRRCGSDEGYLVWDSRK